MSRCPDTSGRPARLPDRVAAVNSAPLRIRAPAGSMTTPASQGSDADALASLAAACCQDGPARPGAHAQPEPMRLGPAAIVRLEGALTHGVSRCGKSLVNAVTDFSSVLRPRRPGQKSQPGQLSASVTTNNSRHGTSSVERGSST
jgi:hypothetical protein